MKQKKAKDDKAPYQSIMVAAPTHEAFDGFVKETPFNKMVYMERLAAWLRDQGPSVRKAIVGIADPGASLVKLEFTRQPQQEPRIVALDHVGELQPVEGNEQAPSLQRNLPLSPAKS